MRRWFLHLVAVVGGAAAVYIAGAVQQFAAREQARTYTVSWSYVTLSHALWALAGFCLLVPVVWADRGTQGRRQVRWGLLSWYLITGLVLASALPLATVAGMAGVRSVGNALIWAVTYHLDIFGAMIIGVACAQAFNTRSDPAQ